MEGRGVILGDAQSGTIVLKACIIMYHHRYISTAWSKSPTSEFGSDLQVSPSTHPPLKPIAPPISPSAAACITEPLSPTAPVNNRCQPRLQAPVQNPWQTPTQQPSTKCHTGINSLYAKNSIHTACPSLAHWVCPCRGKAKIVFFRAAPKSQLPVVFG
ncbi:hypothetical protein VTI74DRAFT_303 [Chaetomium olivicolor]